MADERENAWADEIPDPAIADAEWEAKIAKDKAEADAEMARMNAWLKEQQENNYGMPTP
jgi:hypothetical protein